MNIPVNIKDPGIYAPLPTLKAGITSNGMGMLALYYSTVDPEDSRVSTEAGTVRMVAEASGDLRTFEERRQQQSEPCEVEQCQVSSFGRSPHERPC
jgi:hypothetical protein